MRNRRLDGDEGSSEERREELIRDALAPLQGVRMPAHVRTSTERRMQTALAGDRTGRTGLGQTWWRRRVSVPVPVAAGLVLFLGLSGILQLRQLSPHRAGDKTEITPRSVPVATEMSRPQYYEEGVYVTGVGLVNSERGYRLFKENNHEVR